ncbi:MAG: biotin--[acetyl-CoA-carboxylase] ligase [Dehalococcoidia bacterium]
MHPEPAQPFSVEHFQSYLETRWLGRRFVHEPVVGSTMDIVRQRAAEGAEEGLVVSADEQTAGRGRYGRRWLAPPGVNLAVSILLRPSLERLKTLSIAMPLGVVAGIQVITGLQPSIKWPNDIQINGRKLAGILLESEINGQVPRFAVAGIGLNVNFDTAAEPEIADLATSLLRETGRTHEREAILAACLNAWERSYEAPPLETWTAWRARLNTIGQQIRVSFQGRVCEGLAEDVDADGSLILRQTDGSQVVLPAGEVTLRV